jgi:hypothetical protein
MNARHLAILCGAVLISLVVLPAMADDPNALTEEEKEAGFELLFNGRDFQGWQQSGNWEIDDGAMFRAKRGGSIRYEARKIPDDFELRFQWKVAPGANSGVYYRPTQYEYQILDNQKHADGKNPRTSAASLYFCMAPSHDATKPPGEWNTGRIVCKGTVIQHWLNGQKVIDFDYADPKDADNVELLRLRGGDLRARGAYLSLQDHGDPVWYRGIKLRALGPDDQLDRTPVTPQPIPEEVLKEEKKKLERILNRRAAKAKPKARKKQKDRKEDGP